MDDGLIFPYRRSTDHADARVLTHASAATTSRGRLLRGWSWLWWRVVWGSSVLVGKRVNRGDAQW